MHCLNFLSPTLSCQKFEEDQRAKCNSVIITLPLIITLTPSNALVMGTEMKRQ